MSVINMECKLGMQLMIADNSIDAIVTDPPYGLSKQPKMEEVLKHWLAGDDYNATGSGFPKSLDISKAIDKISPDQAKKWEGFGTALKPAYEPFILARKPLDGTYANNVLKHGVGGLNIDGCRIELQSNDRTEYGVSGDEKSHTGDENTSCYGEYNRVEYNPHAAGRFPANVIHDGLDEPWAKYFYCAKASKKDRDEGLENLSITSAGEMTDREEGSDGLNSPRAGAGRTTGARNIHPTVKPTELMRYLCRLVTPPNGLILDPFSGSGSTGKAAVLEKFNFTGFEMDEIYCEIANKRIEYAHNSRVQS